MDDINKIPNIYSNLSAAPLNAIPSNANISNEQQFRINKINEIKDYFSAEIRERALISKNISKYIASLDYFDKSLNVLSILSGSVFYCIICKCYWSTCRNNWSKLWSCVFNYIRICKNILKTIRNKRKKHNKIVMLARSKLNSIESKISKALMVNEISHEDFETIINKEKNIEN